MDYMKARWTMKCECCKAPILVGAQYVVFHGRPWIPAHKLRYTADRRITTTGSRD